MKKMFLGLACLAGLAACADGRGQVADPRYRFSSDAPYDQYRAAREMALTGRGEALLTVPRARPYNAPTPEMIASPTAIQRMSGQTSGTVAAGTVPASGKGGYYDPATGQRLASAPAARPATVAAPAAAPAQPAPPERPTDALTRYAESQRHAPGTAIYARAGGSAADAARACARSPNPNAAQLQFLASGGPQQDPMGMDPDGDGYVCGWTPAIQRASQL
ncbi:hypothetical protein [Paracoccus xiamenensis]|uniref:hypothetical protein n=1 Tax=Paracoccus xiamenensis TaxID=2714901 RepID=UPI0014087BDB|nr:hypothetical protein [Paracoccus xiamenensis]NHF72548.1 hypothetical protein [Paracoccus xiamenensis]